MKKRNKFNLDYYKPITCNMGEMVPIGITEVLPGDSFSHHTSAVVRAAPLDYPVMHPTHVMIHHWFVPFRLVWDEWEDFIAGGPNGVSVPVYPTISTGVSGFTVGSLGDHLGVTPLVANRDVSALPFRAYALIFNECYRDQDLTTALTVSTASGPDTTTNTTMQNVAWEKDYFTSARPWEQKGVEVSLPLVGEAPVHGIGVSVGSANAASGAARIESDGSTKPIGTREWGSANFTVFDAVNSAGNAGTGGHQPDIYVDGDDFEAPTVNEFRFAMAWQRVLEARARFGSRYTELLRAWGVKSDDARLQRPEYLGGGKETIQFSEVLGTSNDNLGNLGGHGISVMKSNRYNKYFTEHGFVISLMFTRPVSVYADGLEKLWNRRTREEFFQPELQHLGQQEIKNKEVYLNHTNPDGRFAFQDRFDEFRRGNSNIAGQMRTIFAGFTMARLFSSDPALNNSFVKCVPSKDIFTAPSEDALIVLVSHKLRARRNLAKVGTSFIK